MRFMKSLVLVMLLVVIVNSGQGGKILSKIDWNGKDPIRQTNYYGNTIETRIFLPTEMNRGYQTTKEGCNFYIKNKYMMKKSFDSEQQVTKFLTEKDINKIFKNK